MKKVTKQDDFGDFFSVEEWKKSVKSGFFIPDDGTGYLVYPNGSVNEGYGDNEIWNLDEIPVGVLGVMWYNK